MGYCPYYQAIPENCDLFRLLDDDLQAAKLFTGFANCGARPLDLFEEGPEDVQDRLDYGYEGDVDFPSVADVKDAFQRLHHAIERSVAANPGLMDRTAFLNKSQDEIERLLRLHAEALGDPEAIESVPRLLAGVRPFAEPLFDFVDRWNEAATAPEVGTFSPFWLVPARHVQQAASFLRPLDFDRLIAIDPALNSGTIEWLAEDYPAWRALYLQAANLGEAILVI